MLRHHSIAEGRGLANIRAVTEKYQGSLELERREETVLLSVLSAIPQQDENHHI